MSSSIEVPLALVVGRTVALLRRGANLTQHDLAQRTGLRRGTVAWIETGRTMLHFEQVQVLEYALSRRRGFLQSFVGAVSVDLRSAGYSVVPGRCRTGYRDFPLDTLISNKLANWLGELTR